MKFILCRSYLIDLWSYQAAYQSNMYVNPKRGNKDDGYPDTPEIQKFIDSFHSIPIHTFHSHTHIRYLLTYRLQ